VCGRKIWWRRALLVLVRALRDEREGLRYPTRRVPIVDWMTSHDFTHEQFGARRRSFTVKIEAGEMIEKHGISKRGIRIACTARASKKKTPKPDSEQ
jgi:hypothetical protein